MFEKIHEWFFGKQKKEDLKYLSGSNIDELENLDNMPFEDTFGLKDSLDGLIKIKKTLNLFDGKMEEMRSDGQNCELIDPSVHKNIDRGIEETREFLGIREP